MLLVQYMSLYVVNVAVTVKNVSSATYCTVLCHLHHCHQVVLFSAAANDVQSTNSLHRPCTASASRWFARFFLCMNTETRMNVDWLIKLHDVEVIERGLMLGTAK